MSLMKNASPQNIKLGTDDKSTRLVTPSAEPIPQHCPLFYIFAKKGPAGRELLSASKLNTVYGTETFDINDKYFNHQTRFLSAVAGQGNVCMVQRLIPDDAGVNSNAAVYADVIECDIPNYVRDSYGSYVLDPDTNKNIVNEKQPTVKGYKIKFIKETQTEEFKVGNLKPKSGTMAITNTYVPELQSAYDLILKNVIGKISVGDTIPIYDTITTQDGKVMYSISSTNKTVVALDTNSLKWVAKAPGTTTIKIMLTKVASVEGEALQTSMVEFPITITNSVVKSQATMTVKGIKNILTKEEPTMNLIIEGNNSETATVTIKDTTIAKYDPASKSITAKENGITFVTVTIPATVSSEAVSWVFTLQSKIKPLDPVVEVIRSTMYPIFELKAKYPGEYYNNIGFAISSLFNDEVDSKIVSSVKALPFKLALYTRLNQMSSPTVLRSLFSEPSVQFAFKEKAINPNTDARFDFETVYENNWFNEEDQLKTMRYFEFESFHFYREFFEDLSKKIIEKERAFVSDSEEEWHDGNMTTSSTWYDFTTVDQDELMNEHLLLNLFTAKTSKHVPYFTLVKSDIKSTLNSLQKEVSITSDTPIFLDGGSDGTINNKNFETQVIKKMAEYVDPDSEVHDLAINVESIFYDSGFTLDTKKELVNFISLRKDTIIVLSTHDDELGDADLPLSDARAVGNALKTRYQLAPESEYFGTPVCRGIVMVGTGRLRDGSTKRRIPFTYELAMKAAKMMGAGDGKWDSTQVFDNYPGNAINYLIDPSPSFIPAGIKPTLWNDGLVWTQAYDRVSYHIPALQTIYDNDTSVLNNFFTVMCISQLVKSGERVWRKFTGTSTLTNNEFIEQVTQYAMNDINGKFGGLMTVIVEVTITDEDENRGYSWHMTHKLYGNNSKTVGVYTTEVYRSSDLES